jgi:magnesium transporter
MSVPKSTVRSRLWIDGVLQEQDFPFEKISDYLEQDGCLVWVDICDPDHQLLLQLAEELTLDPLAVEDAVSHGERAKATRYATHTFLTAYAVGIRDTGGGRDSPPLARDGNQPPTSAGRLNSTAAERSRLTIARVSAFVLPRGVVTVRLGDRFDAEALLRRWDDNADLLKYGVGALVHGLLDLVVDSHFEAVQILDDAMEDIEDSLFDEQAATTLVQRQTYSIRKDLVELRRIVLPMREVVNAVLRHRKDFHAPTELDPWYDDLYDHVLRASEWTESLRDMVTTIFETNLSLQDSRLNNIMKKLTSWAAIIAVPTAVTGYFGQNVPYPGFGTHWGFLVSLAVIVGMGAGLYAAFKRRGWL